MGTLRGPRGGGAHLQVTGDESGPEINIGPGKQGNTGLRRGSGSIAR